MKTALQWRVQIAGPPEESMLQQLAAGTDFTQKELHTIVATTQRQTAQRGGSLCARIGQYETDLTPGV